MDNRKHQILFYFRFLVPIFYLSLYILDYCMALFY